MMQKCKICKEPIINGHFTEIDGYLICPKCRIKLITDFIKHLAL